MEIVTLADRPDLVSSLWNLSSVWPGFMRHDPFAHLYYDHVEDRWGDWVLMAVDGERTAARGFSVPFAMGSEIDRPDLPSDGWDGVVRWSHQDHVHGHEATTVSALEIVVAPDYQGTGLAGDMIRAMCDNAARHGFSELVAPVRPTGKHLEPETPMQEYVERVREDGLPVDPWLRVHARLGAEIVAVCPVAMTIRGTIAEWQDRTGLSFDRSGPVIVPGALVPVHVDVEQDHAVYVEPGVWMRHRW
ncbi:MAG: N-acetyltransferase [Actinomycetota bacterium]